MADVACAHCGKPAERFFMLRINGEKQLVGACCATEVRATHSQRDQAHVGVGFTKGSPLTPEEIAKRTEQLRRASKTAAQRRAAIRAGVLSEGIPEKPRWNARQWDIFLMHLSNFGSHADIAAAIGYRCPATVTSFLKRPETQKAIEDVRKAQMERIIAGEFGVRAMAKVAAPKVMRGVIDIASSADKPSDRHAASKTVLQVSGDLVETHRHEHVHQLIKGLSRQEVFDLAEHGRWPERLRDVVQNLGLTRALPAPEGNGR